MVGSRMSGSSARPMRSVVWACAETASDKRRAADVAARRKIFIERSPLLRLFRRRRLYTNPGRARAFRLSAEGRDQFFKYRRKAACGGQDGIGGWQLADAMAGGGVACAVGHQSRRFGAAALDHEGAAGVEAAAGGGIECAWDL